MNTQLNSRRSRFLATIPSGGLTLVEDRGCKWWKTSQMTEKQLVQHYWTQGKSMGYQFARLLAAHPGAAEAMNQSEALVFLGPGFGDELEYVPRAFLKSATNQIFAVEKNPAAWRALTFERPFLSVHERLNELPEFEGKVTFVAVHVLAQPSLANDAASEELARQFLRIAKGGGQILTTLPHGYLVESRRAPSSVAGFCRPGINADLLLAQNLEELVKTHIETVSSEIPFSSRLTVIKFGGHS